MKKIVVIILALTLLMSFVGCNKINGTKPNDPQGTNGAIFPPIIPTGNGQKPDNSYIASLVPTHSIVGDYPFIQDDYWEVGKSMDDIEHLTEGHYEFTPANPEEFGLGGSGIKQRVSCDWSDLKEIKLDQVAIAEGVRVVSIVSQDSHKDIVQYCFMDDVDESMTIADAYLEGYWYYVDSNTEGFDYAKFFDEEIAENCVKEIVNKWGMPSEVGYKSFGGLFINFILVYETEGYFVVFEGREFTLSTNDNMKITSMTVCGKSSKAWIPADNDKYTYTE